MFEKAVRMKLRFSHKGLCGVEDLWDLSVVNLDVIFKDLSRTVMDQKEESLLNVKSKDDEILDLKIKIVKHIVEVRLSEQEIMKNRINNAKQKQKILGIISEKQEAGLRDMSVEDLKKMVDELK